MRVWNNHIQIGDQMSILIIEILPQGIVFAADRFLTVSRESCTLDGTVRSQGQDSGCKILKWPHNRALIGAVGRCSLEDRSLYDWLYDFIGDHAVFESPAKVAYDLRDRLQATLGTLDPPESTIVEFATFVNRDGVIVPEMWHITNVHALQPETGEYMPPTNEFIASEQVLGVHLSAVAPAELRKRLADLAAAHNPFWFHQGINLAVFNTLEEGVKAAFRRLYQIG